MSEVYAPRQSATMVTRSNVDVAAIFGVLLTTIGDLEVLVKDIDADALGAMYELIETQSASNLPNDGFNSDDDYEFNDYEILIYTIDDVAALFDVPLNSLKEINEFTKDLKVGGVYSFDMEKSALSVDDSRLVKLYDVPLQVFKEDGISLIAMFIGKPVMLDSYTSSMCNDSWGRSSFARCLIKVNSETHLIDVVMIGIPSLTGDDFTKDTIRVENEWRRSSCDLCKIFDHVHDHCPKKVVSPPIVTTSNVVTPTVEKTNDGFQTVGKKRRGKVSTSAPKKRATNVSNASNSSSMLKTAGTSSKKDDITTSNSYSVLNNEEEDEEENVENVYDESENLFTNTKTGGSSFFMSVTG
ncbi:zinc knuckle CX2CX4HX4C containing protein [Tanacetum coccineum]